MNYVAVYQRLIDRARERDVAGYAENHHITPKCLGGSNRPENIVRLTAREHFIAHRLLTRIHPNNKGIWYALIAMGRIAGFKGKIFASERKRAADMRKGAKFSEASKIKMSQAKKGKPSASPETCFKPGNESWSKGLFGKDAPGYGTRRTLEQRKRMGEAQRSCGNKPPSRKGIKWTEEQKSFARIKRQTALLTGEKP